MTKSLTFANFELSAPDIARFVRARFETTGLSIRATLRADGSPRLSPIEPSILQGQLYVGMMPGSMKARDLQRDGRVALLTTLSDKLDMSGEGKLFGEAVELTDPDDIHRVLSAAAAGTDYDAEAFAGSHVFEVGITGAAWQHVEGDTWVTVSWRVGGPVRRRQRQGPTGSPVDVG
ncbi:MAG: hypothetical protein QOJ19_2668 [Acidimicrobiia bacterium]|nr:hypothetical protein [Acidimicrobiia bacterium]